MDWQRIFEAGSLILCLSYFLTSSSITGPSKDLKLLGWATVFSIGFISSLNAHYPTFAFLEWSWLLALTMLAVLLRNNSDNAHKAIDRLILTTALLSCCMYLVWFWKLNAPIYFEKPSDEIIRKVTFPGFSNVRFFSDYQSFLLLILPFALLKLSSPGWARAMGTAIIGIFFSLALISGSRSLIFSHLFTHTFLWLTFRSQYNQLLLLQAKSWIVGLIIFLFLTKLLPLLIAGEPSSNLVVSDIDRTDSSNRILLWELSWEVIKSHPWLGIGPMHFADLPNSIAAHPHNLIMQFATEWGGPATGVIIGLITLHLKSRITHLKSQNGVETDTTMQLALSSAGIALIIQSMVAGTLNYPISQMLGLIFFAYPYLNQAKTSKDLVSSSSLRFICLILILIFTVSLTTLSSIKTRNACFFSDKWPSQHFSPRFWQQGWITGDCGQSTSLLDHIKFMSQTSLPR